MATFYTRIQNKKDTFKNWTDNDPILLNGEIAIVEVPASSGAVAQEPAILIKVGNGTSKFSELPFSSALAADVYGWAKAETKPTYEANEILNLADYIAGKVQDTDTQYKLEQDATDPHILKLYSKTLNGEWTAAGTITTADTVYDDTAVVNRISALEQKVGNDTVANQIDAKITALNLANTYEAKGEAAKVQGALNEYKTANDAAVKAAADAAAAAQGEVDALEKVVAQHVEDAAEAMEGKVDKAEGYRLMAETEGNKLAAIEENSERNVIVGVQVNGEDLTVDENRKVNVVVPTGELAGKDEVGMDDLSAELQEKLNATATGSDLSDLTDRVTQAEKDIDAIEADYLKAADKQELTEAIATAKQEAIEAVLDGVTDDFDTLKEVAAWIQTDTTNSAELIGRVTAIENDYLKGADKEALQKDIDDLEALVGALPEGAASTTVVAYIQEVVDGLKIGDYAKAADLTALAGRVTQAEADIDALEGRADVIEAKLKDIENGAQENVIEVVKVNGTALEITDKAVDISVPTGALADKDKVAKADLDDALATELNGKANSADLAAVATSGNVDDLVQTENTYFIINCGSSSSVI